MNRNDREASDIIKRLQTYLCIRSDQPTPIYKECIDNLQWIGMELGLKLQLYLNNSKPLLVMTREGTDASLPSLLLTSHMDVVPVSEVHLSSWNFRVSGVVIPSRLKSGMASSMLVEFKT